MNEVLNYLFSLILDLLSHKPLLAETQSNLFKDVTQVLKSKGIKVQNLRKELKTTVDLGQSLGVLTVQNEDVRIPFQLKNITLQDWKRAVGQKGEGIPRSKGKPGPNLSTRNTKNGSKLEKEKRKTRRRGQRNHLSKSRRRAKRTRRARR